jgi:hypothetical protein
MIQRVMELWLLFYKDSKAMKGSFSDQCPL